MALSLCWFVRDVRDVRVKTGVACARIFTVGQPLGSSVLVAQSMPATGGKCRPRLLISDLEKYLNTAITFSSFSQGHTSCYYSQTQPIARHGSGEREQNDMCLKCMREPPYTIDNG